MSARTVGLTGRLDGMSRAEFKELLQRHGASYAAHIDDSVDVVVAGEGALASKLAAARAHGVEVLDLSTLLGRLSASSASTASSAVSSAASVVPLNLPSPDDAPLPIEGLSGLLRVLDVPLATVPPGPLTPSLDLFSHYCLDARTLDMLRFAARAAHLGHPCLLEGDTATSKTSVIRYLAARSGHQVVRLNLNGQSDAAELVGRYVPRAEGGWCFAEGLVPQAMRHGWWVILDEVNLAEPAVLERLNPVLERTPTLVLTEGPGTRFGRAVTCPCTRAFACSPP